MFPFPFKLYLLFIIVSLESHSRCSSDTRCRFKYSWTLFWGLSGYFDTRYEVSLKSSSDVQHISHFLRILKQNVNSFFNYDGWARYCITLRTVSFWFNSGRLFFHSASKTLQTSKILRAKEISKRRNHFHNSQIGNFLPATCCENFHISSYSG